MALSSQPFEIDLGDDVVVEIPVDLPNGAPADLTGATLEFGYGLAPDVHENAGRPSASPVLGSIVIRGLTFPTLNAPLPSVETRALQPFVVYYWAARVTIAGAAKTVVRGTFKASPVPL